MMRILLAIIGVMMAFCIAHAVAHVGLDKPDMRFGKFPAAMQSESTAALLAQNNGEGSNQRGCGRRDKPRFY